MEEGGSGAPVVAGDAVAAVADAARAISSQLDLGEVLQHATDRATELTGAAFGAFFYNSLDDRGESYMLFTLSGEERAAFEGFGMPRNTAVFGPTFAGTSVVRSDDITADDRYGHTEPHRGIPAGHPAVTSYLAVPVVLSDGEVVGGLFFGHPERARFTANHERIAVGIASQAAVAIENARRFAAERELRESLGRTVATLDAALHAGEMGTFHWDAATGVVTWSEGLEQLFGFEPGAFPQTFDAWAERIHPRDRDRILARVQAATGDLQPYDFRHRLVRASDGHTRWMDCRARPIVDADGTFLGIAGVSADVTDRVHREARDAAELAAARAVSELSLVPVAEAVAAHGFDVVVLWRIATDGTARAAEVWSIPALAEGEIVSKTRSLVLPPGEGFPGTVAAAGDTLRLLLRDVDPARYPRHVAASADGIQVGVGVPVSDGTRITGVLEVDARDPDAAGDDVVEILEAMAGPIGRLLARLDAEDAVRRRSEQLRRLADFAVRVNATTDLAEVVALAERGAGLLLGAPASARLGGDVDPAAALSARLSAPDGSLLGAIDVGPREGSFDEEDEAILVQLAEIVSASVHKGVLYEDRVRVAAALQRSLLPPDLPDVPGLDVGARYHAGSEDVGGDFYDLFPLGGGAFGVAVGDVCGKGPEAAALTALARHGVRTAAVIGEPTDDVLRILNRTLLASDSPRGRFCTAAFGRLLVEGGAVELELASAGHPPVLVVGSDGSHRQPWPTGQLLGIYDDVRVGVHRERLAPGDVVVLYTDGITEARRGRELFGEERLVDVVVAHRDEPAAAIAAAVVEAASAFGTGRDVDDQAVLVLKRAETR